MTLRVVHDAETPEAKVARHAEDMRQLFGRMLQVAAGGGGIENIGKLLKDAAASLQEICDCRESRALGFAVQEVKKALQPEFPHRDWVPYHSFSANKGDIVAMALRVAAHERLRSGTPQINAEHALHDAIKPMLERR